MLAVEAVETDILTCARASFIIERVGDAGAGGHASPYGRGVIGLVVVDGQSALVELLAILEHVLAYLTEVDVEFATVALVVARVDEGVEHPELDVFEVLRLEVGVVHLAHHAAPVLLRGQESAVCVKVGVEVVGSSLGGIIGQVQHVQRSGLLVGVLFLVGVEVALEDLADVVVGELVEVALDVGGRERTAAAREDGVDVVPGEASALVATAHVVSQSRTFERSRYRGEHPSLWLRDALTRLRVLEIVHVRGSALYLVVLPGNQLGEVRAEGNLRGRGEVE